jgi:putative RNA 2'-phosphotransferase
VECENRVRTGYAAECDVLYHRTAEKNRESISENGRLKGARNYAYLSADVKIAVSVGARHGNCRKAAERLSPCLFEADAEKMSAAGTVFPLSENGVWLVETVAPKYLNLLGNVRIHKELHTR